MNMQYGNYIITQQKRTIKFNKITLQESKQNIFKTIWTQWHCLTALYQTLLSPLKSFSFIEFLQMGIQFALKLYISVLGLQHWTRHAHGKWNCPCESLALDCVHCVMCNNHFSLISRFCSTRQMCWLHRCSIHWCIKAEHLVYNIRDVHNKFS